MGLLLPRKVKHRKWSKGRSRGIENRATELSFGIYGLKSYGTARVTSRQIEAARRVVIRYMKKGGKLWIRIFPQKPITSKGVETAMGGGKGGVDHYVFPIRPGRMIFEIDGMKESDAREALAMAGDKLPVKTKFIMK